MHADLKHSFCCRCIKEKGLPVADLRKIRGHARSSKLMRYAKTELARKRELMKRKVIRIEKRRAKIKVAS